MLVTAESLRKMRACPGQVAKFELRYPDGIIVPRSQKARLGLATRLLFEGFNVAWFAARVRYRIEWLEESGNFRRYERGRRVE